ncbi:MAG TPA: DnaA regulatory inactivator Hda [Steroidobacteraceae bacterium]|nr:DnaA regulatory inactivator Hda [Steroidobacteraceae bacterium]
MRQLPLGVRIPDRAVFDSFLPGANREALEHAVAIAEGAASGGTWICGGSGAGKTHLLQAICARASERARAGYVPLRQIAPLGVGILDGLPQLQYLCLDDIDAVIGRADWEQALFGLVHEMVDTDGRLVVAAKSPPRLLHWALPDLGSRFAAVAVFQLRALDEPEQQEALQLRARLRGLTIPDETVRWLQRRFPRDMHSLYGLLDTLDEAALVAQRRLTVPFIRSVLKE